MSNSPKRTKNASATHQRSLDPAVESLENVAAELISQQSTARKAAAILVAKNVGFHVPSALQRQNLLVAFAKKGLVVYGKAFDVVQVAGSINLDDIADVEKSLSKIVPCEIKSSRKVLPVDFSGYFFALTAGEVLVAQSLKKQFRFVFVNTTTGEYLEMDLQGIFKRARGIHPTWSISF